MECCRCGSNPDENVVEPNVQVVQPALQIQPPSPPPPPDGTRTRLPRKAHYKGTYDPSSPPIYPNYGEGILHSGILVNVPQFKDKESNPQGTNGVCTKEAIMKNTFLGNYPGIEIDQTEKERLVHIGQGSYLMYLGIHEENDQFHYWLDASNRDNTNILSSINSSCVKEDINVYFEKYYINGTNGGIACLGAFTSRDIKKDEDLFFHAGHTLMNELVPVEYHIQCLCQGFKGVGVNRRPVCDTIMP
jgi:hypothetical protein